MGCPVCEWHDFDDERLTEADIDDMTSLIMRGEERALFDFVQQRQAPYDLPDGRVYEQLPRRQDGRPVIA